MGAASITCMGPQMLTASENAADLSWIHWEYVSRLENNKKLRVNLISRYLQEQCDVFGFDFLDHWIQSSMLTQSGPLVSLVFIKIGALSTFWASITMRSYNWNSRSTVKSTQTGSPLWQPLTVAGKLMSKHFAQSASETTCESHKAGSKSWSRSRKGTSTGSYYLWWISPWNGLISSTVHQKKDMNSAPKPIDWWLYGLILILFLYILYIMYIYI